jgi:hypothetical protein
MQEKEWNIIWRRKRRGRGRGEGTKSNRRHGYNTEYTP